MLPPHCVTEVLYGAEETTAKILSSGVTMVWHYGYPYSDVRHIALSPPHINNSLRALKSYV
jgi:hypothetical protein